MSRWKIRCIVFVVNIFVYSILAIAEYYILKSPLVDYLDLQTHVVFHCVVYCALFIAIDLTLSTIFENQWVTSAISSILSPFVWFLTLWML